eukprot:TRINITY_DN3483_c0_g2_i2.p1 TRINITY_DN3483_c0_g2~~TRINITY_DN3483_c0_g2_i2.p1  ORF type:complete len:335 (+),score=109.61 TRINITY_DN3483_c0_g2_i2:38-1006(+)
MSSNAEANLAAPPPENCPGTSSEQAGKGSACAGCPNQTICATAPKGPDPDVAEITKRLSTVKHKILILSGKGGVGKSTFSAQLSFALSKKENQIGLMDIDICGPSIPRLLGLEGSQIHQSNLGWSPVYVEDNLGVMSVGFMLNDPNDAVIWRGAKKNGLIKQFLRDVDWGDLDYLIVDTPPGTSDEHLSIVQYLKEAKVDGAVIVTTPQEVSLMDVRKEVNFCRKVGVPIIGIVENMSGFVCPNCKNETKIFPPTTGGALKMCQDMDLHFLGAIPLDPRIARACDEGRFYMDEFPDSEATKQFNKVIDGILERVNTEKKGQD